MINTSLSIYYVGGNPKRNWNQTPTIWRTCSSWRGDIENRYMAIYVSCSYYNKLPQTRQLQTTEMYSLMVPGARSSNQAISRAIVCPEALWENPLCLFQLLLVPGHPWWSLTCNSISPVSVSICTWYSSLGSVMSYKNTSPRI